MRYTYVERSIDDIQAHVVDSFMAQCPYRFECEETAFQSLFIWIAVAYPMLMGAIKVFAVLVPFTYAQLLRFDKEHQSQKKEQQTQVSERPRHVDGACVVAPDPEAAEVAASSMETLLKPIRDSLMELKLHVENNEEMLRDELKSVGRRLDELERRINIPPLCKVEDRSDNMQHKAVAKEVKEVSDLQQAVARSDKVLQEVQVLQGALCGKVPQEVQVLQETSRKVESLSDNTESMTVSGGMPLNVRPQLARSATRGSQVPLSDIRELSTVAGTAGSANAGLSDLAAEPGELRLHVSKHVYV